MKPLGANKARHYISRSHGLWVISELLERVDGQGWLRRQDFIEVYYGDSDPKDPGRQWERWKNWARSKGLIEGRARSIAEIKERSLFGGRVRVDKALWRDWVKNKEDQHVLKRCFYPGCENFAVISGVGPKSRKTCEEHYRMGPGRLRRRSQS